MKKILAFFAAALLAGAVSAGTKPPPGPGTSLSNSVVTIKKARSLLKRETRRLQRKPVGSSRTVTLERPIVLRSGATSFRIVRGKNVYRVNLSNGGRTARVTLIQIRP